jgi:hypothetical protein
MNMGLRGEVFSSKLVKNDRTYFFNVKENIYGDMFLNIVESKGTPDEGRFIRQSVIVYQEDLGEFVKELQKSIDYIKMHDNATGPYPLERRPLDKDGAPKPRLVVKAVRRADEPPTEDKQSE